MSNQTEKPPIGSPSALDIIEGRASGIGSWLSESGVIDSDGHRHLDAGTPEQWYWHHGYQEALKDVLALLGNASTKFH